MLFTRVSSNQSNAALLIGARVCQKLASRVGSAPVARRGAPAAAAPSARSAFNIRELADTKYARRKRPVLEDAPPPVAARQLLPRRGLLGDQVRVARERRYARLRPAATSSATTARDAAATAGLTVFTSSCSVADAATAPSFASTPRRAELRERAAPRGSRSGADGHDCSFDLRSVSQWVRRVYRPQPRRETDRLLSSPATAECISHVCGSRPHATRCAWAVHGMKCGWRA